LDYIRSTRNQYVKISSIGTDEPEIRIYTDASHGTHRSGHSHSGRAVFVGLCAGVVSYASSKQPVVTLSSTDAEMYAVSESDYVGEFYSSILQVFGFKPRVKYLCDNQSTIQMIESGVLCSKGRRRHVIIRTNALAEMFRNSNDMSLEYVPTEANWSDVLTKPLPKDTFETMKAVLCGHGTNHSL